MHAIAELGCDTPACFGPLRTSIEDDAAAADGDDRQMRLSAAERTAVGERRRRREIRVCNPAVCLFACL